MDANKIIYDFYGFYLINLKVLQLGISTSHDIWVSYGFFFTSYVFPYFSTKCFPYTSRFYYAVPVVKYNDVGFYCRGAAFNAQICRGLTIWWHLKILFSVRNVISLYFSLFLKLLLFWFTSTPLFEIGKSKNWQNYCSLVTFLEKSRKTKFHAKTKTIAFKSEVPNV